MRHQKGFTLIEISPVVVIVGILAVTAVPTYQEYIARSQIKEAFNIASSYKVKMASVHAKSVRCPTLDDFSLDSLGTIKTRYLSTVIMSGYADADCAFTISFSNVGPSAYLQNKKIQMAMTSKSGGATWTCYSSDIQQRFLPRECNGI